MTKVGLLSDTHGFLHPDFLAAVSDCEQLWHAGDFGNAEIFEQLKAAKPSRGVWGNIDDTSVRHLMPEDDVLEVNQRRVLLSHIVGYPTRLHKRAKLLVKEHDPDLVIYGHSHILRLDYAKTTQALFVNPGAMGNQGGHLIRTAMTFELQTDALKNVTVLEFGNRGAACNGITKRVDLGDWPLRLKTN